MFSISCVGCGFTGFSGDARVHESEVSLRSTGGGLSGGGVTSRAASTGADSTATSVSASTSGSGALGSALAKENVI